nr:GNAT family N-acetyltransferase [Mesorhizobium liriopis]
MSIECFAGARMEIRQIEAVEDPILVSHYLAVWASYAIPHERYRADAEDMVRAFIAEGRLSQKLGVFVAFIEGEPVGSVACQLQTANYPNLLKPETRTNGYVWSVFVDDAHRGKGIAKALMQRAMDYLRAIGCTTAVLNSSDAGESLYLGLGFQHVKEMRLSLDGSEVD